jgi:hypothetical protein
MTKTIQEATAELNAACDRADAVAEAVRVTFDSMSATDRKNVQAAVLRAQRKALAKDIKALTPTKEQP